VRARRLATLSIAATALLLLAGCSASGGGSTSPSPTASAAADLCSAAAAPGAASDAVTVSGAAGTQPTATFTAPLDITDVERTVVTEGTGTAAAEGDYVTYAVAGFDPATGTSTGASGYESADAPQQLTANSVLGQILGCATPGTRVVATLPESSSGAAQVFVVDLISVTPEAQWCTAEPFDTTAPTVDFSTGTPVITVPSTEQPPTGVRLDVVKKGDGATVEPGDTVSVNYLGVKWSDGTTFDSSYEKGEAVAFPTTGVVVGFKRALEGQTVGSQILVSMAPACGYGEAGSSSNALAGETLVFALEIADIQK
jgi:hypothetical protein